MKLLLDQNVSFRVIKLIEEIYPNSVHVKQVNLENASDIDIRKYAITNDFIIVTFDDDFNKYNELLGPPPVIIWLRKGNLTNQQVAAILIAHKSEIVSFYGAAGSNTIGVLEII